MKLSSRLAKLMRDKAKPTEGKPPAQENGRKFKLWHWALGALCLLVTGGGTWAVLKVFVWNKVPPELVGTWEVKDGPMKGGTFNFFPNGTLEIRSVQGPFIRARVAVDGKKLSTTTKNPSTLRDETRTSIIQDLTENSLVLELERGDVLKMVRRKQQ